MNTRVSFGLSVVQLVAGRADPTVPMSVGAIARELRTTLSGTSRLCSELESLGLIEHGDAYGSYRIGREAIRLSGRAAAPFTHELRFALTLAAQQTGETVCLAARSADGIRVVASVESMWTLYSPAQVGDAISDGNSAIARAFDGAGPDPDRAATTLAGEASLPVESTIGLGVEIAMPIHGPAGEPIAVVAVRLPSNRTRQNLARARRAVLVASRGIQSAFDAAPGATRPDWSRVDTDRSPTALEATVRVLWHLAGGHDSIAATARATGLRADRVQRLLDTCRAAGFVTAGPERDLQLSWIVFGWHRAAAIPTMVDSGTVLVAATAHRTLSYSFLTVLKGMRSLTIVEELGPAGEGLRMSPWLGRAHPIVGSDGGPTMLMDFTPDEITRLFPARHTPKELDVFLQRVREVQRRGVLVMHAFDDGGLLSISAPVRDSSGAVVAAVCLVGMNEYVRNNTAELEGAARALAAAVTALVT